MRNKKILLMVVVCIVLATSIASASEFQPYSAETRCMGEFRQTDDYEAMTEIFGMNSEVSEQITSTIQLQEYSVLRGVWLNSSVSPRTERIYNSSTIHQVETFEITPGRDYRVKIKIVSVKDGVTNEFNCYFELVR